MSKVVHYFEYFPGILGFSLGLPENYNLVGYAEKRENTRFPRKLDKIRGRLLGNAVPPVFVNECIKSLKHILE